MNFHKNMKKWKIFCLMLAVLFTTDGIQIKAHEIYDYDYEATHSADDDNVQVMKNRLAVQLFAALEHYKQEDPVGFPGAPIPDPMDVPDMKQSLGMATLTMMKVKIQGLSKFRIVNINADLNAMKVDAGIELDIMHARGMYSLSSLFSKANGPFTVILKNVFIRASASLQVQRDGHLTTEHIKMDITFKDMSTDFKNLGFLGSVFQSIVQSAPTLVFDAMKPFLLQEADKQLRKEINKNIVKLMGDKLLPNSITPLDMVIAEARKTVREQGYDPYRLPDYNRRFGIFGMQLSNTWINGISSFYRVGDVVVSMQNNTVTLIVKVGTQQIAGAGQWEVDCGLVSRVGHVQFTLQHIRLTLQVSQALDTRKRPQINDLQIDLGNIQVRCDGAGTLDYILEMAVNVLPNLLRYQIMDVLENPIKIRIQEKFNAIDVEQAIKDNFEKFQSNGKIPFDFNV